MLPIVSRALGLLADIPTLAACRERMELAKETILDLGRKLEDADARIEKLQADLDARPSPEFADHRGVLWKRNADGTYAPDPYCPTHRRAMSKFGPEVICTVTKCGYSAPFDDRGKSAAHASIPKNA